MRGVRRRRPSDCEEIRGTVWASEGIMAGIARIGYVLDAAGARRLRACHSIEGDRYIYLYILFVHCAVCAI